MYQHDMLSLDIFIYNTCFSTCHWFVPCHHQPIQFTWLSLSTYIRQSIPKTYLYVWKPDPHSTTATAAQTPQTVWGNWRQSKGSEYPQVRLLGPLVWLKAHPATDVPSSTVIIPAPKKNEIIVVCQFREILTSSLPIRAIAMTMTCWWK